MTIKEMIADLMAKGETKQKAQIEVGKRVRAMIDSGYSNKEVANKLGIAEATVRSIRKCWTEEPDKK